MTYARTIHARSRPIPQRLRRGAAVQRNVGGGCRHRHPTRPERWVSPHSPSRTRSAPVVSVDHELCSASQYVSAPTPKLAQAGGRGFSAKTDAKVYRAHLLVCGRVVSTAKRALRLHRTFAVRPPCRSCEVVEALVSDSRR